MCIMKKLILFIVLGLGLGFVSCEKQEIRPTTNSVSDAPSWEQSISPCNSPAATSGTTSNPTGSDDPDGGGITDPNDDEDGNGRKKV